MPPATVDLTPLFAPRGVAVLGASRNPAKLGHRLVQNLITSGFPGDIFPVNPSGEAILGKDAVTRAEDVPRGLDLALVSLPATAVVPAVRALGTRGCRMCVVLASGFGETGRTGRDAQEEIEAIARTTGMRIVGPNCMGVVNVPGRLNASYFWDVPWQPGAHLLRVTERRLRRAVLPRGARAIPRGRQVPLDREPVRPRVHGVPRLARRRSRHAGRGALRRGDPGRPGVRRGGPAAGAREAGRRPQGRPGRGRPAGRRLSHRLARRDLGDVSRRLRGRRHRRGGRDRGAVRRDGDAGGAREAARRATRPSRSSPSRAGRRSWRPTRRKRRASTSRPSRTSDAGRCGPTCRILAPTRIPST